MKKTVIALSVLAAMLVSMTACGGEKDSQDSVSETEASTTEVAEEVTEAPTEEETLPPTNAAFPEADANAVTFDDGNFAFASIICDDATSADGTLSVETIDGNAMLKYTDTTTTAENMAEMVQKVSIDVTKLLTPEQYASVNSIQFDVYAKAEADAFVGESGENLKVPGWIGGGGGSVTADDKWYGFADYSAADINEFNLERSDACHVEFKFLLASGGKCWSAEMEAPNFLIMRWGMQNVSSMYIDNITFYDADGNSLPLMAYGTEDAAEEEASAAEEAEKDAAEEAEAEKEAEESARSEAEAEREAAEKAEAEKEAEESAQSEAESAE